MSKTPGRLIRISDTLWERLGDFCQEHDISRSELIRQLITNYLENQS